MKLGAEGEQIALKFMEARGFILVSKNFRFQRAEVDIIVKDEGNQLLVFIEVKTRRNRKFGEPEESVTQRKVNQICKSAEGFLMKNPEYNKYTRRFDVIAIMIQGKSVAIKHYENAF